jgi:hypothetical protein
MAYHGGFVPNLKAGDQLLLEYDGWNGIVTVDRDVISSSDDTEQEPLYNVWVNGYSDFAYPVFWTVDSEGRRSNSRFQTLRPAVPPKKEPFLPDMHRDIIRDE